MVDTARQLLDELMGRNRNLDPTTAKSKKVQWDDPEVNEVKQMKFNFSAINDKNPNAGRSFLVHFSFVCIIW